MPNFQIRMATQADNSLILSFIQKIAAYEKMAHEVETTEEMLYDSLFVKKAAEVLIGEEDGRPVGFALFFHNFSTFTGRRGLYLEDLFLDPAYRGKGYGKAMFHRLAQIAAERDCARMEWTCLNWNTPSIRFYESMNARAMDEWTVRRLNREQILEMAARKGFDQK